MRKLFFIIICFFGLFCKSQAHYKPYYNMSYTYVNDSTYHVTITMYLSCIYYYYNSGPAIPHLNSGNNWLLYKDTCNYTTNILSTSIHVDTIMANGLPFGSEVAIPRCNGTLTHCDSLNPIFLYSLKQFEWSGDITLPERCGKWIIYKNGSGGSGERDSSLTNLQYINGAWYFPYTEVIINNLDSVVHNNSPVFNGEYLKLACANQHTTHNLQFYEPDGDSVVVYPENVLDRGYGTANINVSGTVPYVVPFTKQGPFATSNSYLFNPNIQGLNISFSADYPQLPLLSYRADEYRNGVFIGSLYHEMLYNIVPCNKPIPQQHISTALLQNASLIGMDSFSVCANTPTVIASHYTTGDSSATIKYSDNASLIFPTANNTASGIGSDSVQHLLSFTPSNADTGYHLVHFQVADTSCTTSGIIATQDFYYHIFIRPSLALPDSVTLCSGASLPIITNLSNTITWSGGAFTCNNTPCSNVTLTPATTSNYIATVTGGLGTCVSSDTIHIKVYNNYLVSTHDTSVCSYTNSINLSAFISNPSNTPLIYQWSGNGILGANNSASVNVNPNVNNVFTLSVTDSNACYHYLDTITVGYDPFFSPVLSLTPTEVCKGDVATLIVDSTSSATISITPNNSVHNISNHEWQLTPSATQTYQVKIESTMSDCKLDTLITLQVVALKADAGADRTITKGGTTKLGGSQMQFTPNTMILWTPSATLDLGNPLFPQATPEQNTEYILTLSNPTETCVSKDSVWVYLRCSDIYMPNAFNPHSTEEANRTFGVKNRLNALDYFRIYNRRGNLVFETRNVNESWNGTKDGKPLGLDTYYYVLQGTCPDGAIVFKKGDVVLVR